jgi:hypothetical protein
LNKQKKRAMPAFPHPVLPETAAIRVLPVHPWSAPLNGSKGIMPFRSRPNGVETRSMPIT